MRDWCKHRYGFVNFDDEYMYFTSSGNWSDTQDLGELNEDGYRSASSFEKYKAGLFYILFSICIILLFTRTGFKVDFFLMIIVTLAVLAVHNYLSTSLSSKFKIPYSKIESIEIREQTVDIFFSDFNGKEEKQHLQGLYSKGAALFAAISDNYLHKKLADEKSDMNQWEI
jgi:hypothetical protein